MDTFRVLILPIRKKEKRKEKDFTLERVENVSDSSPN
jgi:hypothetical protein